MNGTTMFWSTLYLHSSTVTQYFSKSVFISLDVFSFKISIASLIMRPKTLLHHERTIYNITSADSILTLLHLSCIRITVFQDIFETTYFFWAYNPQALFYTFLNTESD